MNTPLSFSAAIAVSLLCLCVLSERAQAVAITGEINFAGSATVNNSGLVDATAFTGFSGVSVVSSSGDYAGVGSPAVSYPATGFSFNPLSPSPVSPLWTFMVGPDTYSFDLEDVSIEFQSSNFLMLSGNGIASISGFDDTVGMWNFSATSFGSTTFGFSAASQTVAEGPTAVPEGGSALAMLGLSLFGMVSLRRRFKA